MKSKIPSMRKKRNRIPLKSDPNQRFSPKSPGIMESKTRLVKTRWGVLKSSPSYVQYDLTTNEDLKPFEAKIAPLEAISGLFKAEFEKAKYLVDKFDAVRDCATVSKWIWHKNCGKPVSSYPRFCGDKIHCPICARNKATALGNSAFERLWEIPALNYAHVVLTISPWVAGILEDWYGEDKWGIRNYLFKQANTWLKHNFKMLPGALVNVHSWSSKEPLKSPHWHVHILLPLVDVLKTRQGYKLKSWNYGALTEERLEVLRTSWGGLFEQSMLHVHWEFTQRRHEGSTGKLRHWCKYLMRVAILDVNQYLMPKTQWNRIPNKSDQTGPISPENPGKLESKTELSEEEEYWFSYHVEWRRQIDGVERRFRANRWFGLLSDGAVGKFISTMYKNQDLTGAPIYDYSMGAIKKRQFNQAEERKKRYCPWCFEEIKPEEWTNAQWGPFRKDFVVLCRGHRGRYGGNRL